MVVCDVFAEDEPTFPAHAWLCWSKCGLVAAECTNAYNRAPPLANIDKQYKDRRPHRCVFSCMGRYSLFTLFRSALLVQPPPHASLSPPTRLTLDKALKDKTLERTSKKDIIGQVIATVIGTATCKQEIEDMSA